MAKQYSWGFETMVEASVGSYVLHSDYAALQESHARLLKEMERFRPVLERAFERPQDWTSLTAGTGVATPNAYVAAIAAAQPFAQEN